MRVAEMLSLRCLFLLLVSIRESPDGREIHVDVEDEMVRFTYSLRNKKPPQKYVNNNFFFTDKNQTSAGCFR